MRVTEAYSDLRAMGRPVVTTAEAATRWRTSRQAGSQRLSRLGKAGLVRRLRPGLWAVDPDVDPVVVAPYLTAPLPGYVSLWSALARHGMIEQIPREVFVVTVGRARKVDTSIGTFDLHQITPELFDGYEGSNESGYLATPEKALFDLVYLRSAQRRRAHFPELTLPPNFGLEKVRGWIDRIGDPSLRTLVARRLRDARRQTTGKAALQ